MKSEICEKCGVIQYGFSPKDLKYRMSMHQRSKKCQAIFNERTKNKTQLNNTGGK